MWTCKKCGRTFEKTNQSHSCGLSEPTIEAYIALQDEAIQPSLLQLHTTLLEVFQTAEERMSWSMPTYWKSKNLLHFSVHKNHVSLHVGSLVIEQFEKQLVIYKKSKAAIQFPFDQALPLHLIREIALFIDNENQKNR